MDSTSRDKCYLDAGVKSKDVSLCNKIADDALKQVCLAIVTEEPSLCEGIAEEAIKTECYRLCEEWAG